jgi:hypothetical protein
MVAVVTTLLGGFLAISGGLVGIALTDRRERSRWLRDSQLQASADLVTALQLLVRRMINVAYLDPAESGSYEVPEFEKRRPQNERAEAVMAAFDDATAGWNSARHKALLITPPRVAEKVPELDREVDRLIDLAHARAWTRAEFRKQRVPLGRMAADYLKLARRLAGLPDIQLTSIWAWDSSEPAPIVQQSAAVGMIGQGKPTANAN